MCIDAFDNLFQQDAHEFLNYLLNTCADILKEEMRELKKLDEARGHSQSYVPIESAYSSSSVQSSTSSSGSTALTARRGLLNVVSNKHAQPQPPPPQPTLNGVKSSLNRPADAKRPQEQELTWIHELFQGILVNETKCLNCETVCIILRLAISAK